MWCFVQRTGSIYNPDGQKIGIGYSGNHWGLNNPKFEDVVGIGPIPHGRYTIGPAHTPLDHLGPLAMPLIPVAGTEMHGRSGFFCHGDNRFLNHTASNGCIVLAHGFREQIDNSTDCILTVVAEENEVAAVYAAPTEASV